MSHVLIINFAYFNRNLIKINNYRGLVNSRDLS